MQQALVSHHLPSPYISLSQTYTHNCLPYIRSPQWLHKMHLHSPFHSCHFSRIDFQVSLGGKCPVKQNTIIFIRTLRPLLCSKATTTFYLDTTVLNDLIIRKGWQSTILNIFRKPQDLRLGWSPYPNILSCLGFYQWVRGAYKLFVFDWPLGALVSEPLFTICT